MGAIRQLAAIMFTDLVGYTALMQQNEALAKQVKDRSNRIFDESLQEHNGKLLQNYGDGTLSIFSSALEAVKCAVNIQTHNQQGEKIDMRIGIHLGDVMFDDTGIYGDSVNVASRIESLATPGAVFISEKLFEEIRNQSIEAKPLGYFELKNVFQPVNVYAVSAPGIVVPSRDEVKGKVKQTLNSIAVLPFVHMSSSPDDEYFCDGISEEIINVLSKVDGLQVTSRTSAFIFKGKTEDVREIAAKLNVQKVLEGSVRKAGNKVRITAQLINAADGYHLWSETYDRSLEDIFAVQDEIAREIAKKFKLNLNEADYHRELVQAPTTNFEAYKKYLQGLHFWNKQTIEGIFKALALFNEAAALEPTFINPLVHIININAFFTHAAFITVEQGRLICTQALEKIMKIDSGSPWSLVARGLVAFYFDWDFQKSEQCFKEALEKNNSMANACLYLSWIYAMQGNTGKVLDILKTAHRLDPLGGDTLAGASEVCFITGLLNESEQYAQEALANDGHNIYAGSMLAQVVGFKGDWQRAEEMMRALYQIVPEFKLVVTFTGIVLAKNGKKEEALRLAENLEKMHNQPDMPALDGLLSLIYLALGDKEKFYDHYEQALQKKIVTSLYYYGSPFMEEVREEERLKKLLRGIHPLVR